MIGRSCEKPYFAIVHPHAFKAEIRIVFLLAAGLRSLSADPPDTNKQWAAEQEAASQAAKRSDLADAERHELLALRLAETFGPNNMRLETSLTGYGALLQRLSRYADAKKTLESALAIREAVFDPKSLEVAFAKNNLGAACQELGELERARSLYSDALAIAEHKLGPADPRLAPYLVHMASLLRLTASYAAAEQMLNRALVVAPDDAKARILTQMGRIYVSEGRLRKAEEAYNQALSLYETAGNLQTLDGASVLSNLGDLFSAQGLYQKAIAVLGRAQNICASTHTMGTIGCLTTLSNLASAEQGAGNFAGAEELYRRCLESELAAFGRNHSLTAATLNNLGEFYLMRGRYKEAEENLSQARDIWKTTVGPTNPDYATALTNLGSVYALQHKYKKSEPLYREAAEIDGANPAAGLHRFARDLNGLGVALFAQKRYPESEELFRRALQAESARQELGGAASDSTLNLASAIAAQGRRDEALPLYRQGIAMLADRGLNDTPQMASALDNYSSLLRQLEQYADAEKASTEALGIRVRQAIREENN